MMGKKLVDVELCDICKKEELRDWNDWCVACNKVICDNCVSEECDDGAICKKCEKKGFEIRGDDNTGYVLFYKNKIWKGEDFW